MLCTTAPSDLQRRDGARRAASRGILCLLLDRPGTAQGDYQCVFIAIEEVHCGYSRISAGYIDGPSWFASTDPVDLILV